jgi:RES domain-containing protein
VTVWRIAARAHAALDGEGACLYGSRWTPRGLPAVFSSATLSLAALERFVHTDPDLEPGDLVAIEMELPAGLRIATLAFSDLPANWRQYPAPVELSLIGARWIQKARTVALSVPSVVIPRERNLILNPGHADFARVSVATTEPFAFDPRMWKPR